MFWITVALLAAGPAQAGAPAAGSEAVADKVKCRKTPVTGSLARRTRVCRTAAEWRRLDDQSRDAAERAVDQGAVSCGACRVGG